MKRYYYIFTPGKLSRKDNTIFFIPFKDFEQEDDENLQNELLMSFDGDYEESIPSNKTVLPINDIDSIFLMTTATFNTKLISFCSQNSIPIHFFNHYGYYDGTFYPRETLISGRLLVMQAKAYSSKQKRLIIAKKFIEAGIYNIVKNLKYYGSRDRDLANQIEAIEEIAQELPEVIEIVDIMNIEGRIRKIYYSTFDQIIKSELKFDSRKYNPPSNEINALMSFVNALVYTAVISEIYRTQLNPAISYLHEPGERRFSLALDIAEVFKPIFADRLIFKLINNEQISNKHFESRLNGCYLNEKGRKIVVQEFDEKLKTIIKHKELKRQLSYRRIIRLECYKLIKHLLGEKEYEPFKIWW
ncbi:MAG: type I-B CRISPR-associated endonuclease Cas1b [Candidatus Kapabacteria bacterium]|nr:type I-B CRISPR-associated endonuclease Cas1b [Candidatus Kapabacteria bacterium]